VKTKCKEVYECVRVCCSTVWAVVAV
jgi:hypothetical protein